MGLRRIKSILEKIPIYIATSDDRMNPHVIAVACVKVIDNKTFLITDNYMKTTRKNIMSNGKIEILVYDKEWKGYRINGKAKYYDSGKWLKYVKGMKENKGHPAKGAILVTILKIKKLS
ncbi:pyridoxamine 5'-phosphate oxidase family protein [Candidatus Woesearchaeota archaeon]|nr:pyridoxamine 5'-phosphate oxidase family protein [Candidatus Woesearchaeota archaeon]